MSHPAPRRVLLVTGGDFHDFDAAARILTESLQSSGRFTVTHVVKARGVSNDAGVPEFATLSRDRFDAVLLHTQGGKLSDAEEAGLVKFVESGGGLVGLHAAAGSFTANERFMKLLGCRFVTHPPGVFRFSVEVSAQHKAAGHPLVVRSDNFEIEDEHYVLSMIVDDVEVVATSLMQAHGPQPMACVRRQGKGTVVYLANGHHAAALRNRYFQRLLERSLRLATGDTFERKTINVGILGYGGAFNMGRHHAEAIRAQLGMDVVAVCDADPKRAAQAKTELGERVRTCTDMNQLIADPDVQMIVVILPHNLHAPACMAAAKAGKHVVTEKPFCITLEEADAMIAAARDSGTMLSCFHNRRWDGDFFRMLQIVRAGEIGDVFHIDAASSGYGMPGSWWRSKKEMSGGVLYDWGAHFCDWVLNLMPYRIESVSGHLQKRYWHQSTNEDFARVFIRFEGGRSATLEQGMLAAVPRPAWRILGVTGAIASPHVGADFQLVQVVNGLRREATIKSAPGQMLGYYQNVANHLLLGERLIVTPEQARRTIGVFRMAELSSAQGGKPLAVPGEDAFTPDYMIPY